MAFLDSSANETLSGLTDYAVAGVASYVAVLVDPFDGTVVPVSTPVLKVAVDSASGGNSDIEVAIYTSKPGSTASASPGALLDNVFWFDNAALGTDGSSVTTLTDLSDAARTTYLRGTAPTVSGTVLTPTGGKTIRFAGAGSFSLPKPMSRVDVTASSHVDNTVFPGYAMDGNSGTYWLSTATTSGWLQAKYVSAFVSTGYKITCPNSVVSRMPKNWTFEGSNDGSTWTVLDTQTNQAWTSSGQEIAYTFTNSTAYRYYKLNVSAAAASTQIQVGELSITGAPTESPNPTSGEIWAVLVADNVANGSWGSWGADNLGSHYPYNDGNIYDDFGSATRMTVPKPAAVHSLHILRIVMNAGAWRMEVDGTTIGSGSSTVAWPLHATIGSGNQENLSSVYWNGNYAEFAAFRRALDSAEADTLRNYLKAKHWGTALPTWPTPAQSMLISNVADGEHTTSPAALSDNVRYYWSARSSATGASAWGPWASPWSLLVDLDGGWAAGTSYVNVGVTLTSTPNFYEAAYSNVGVEIKYFPNFVETLFENVGVERKFYSGAAEQIYEGDVSTNTPTPHIWFLRPTYGRAFDGFMIVGSGFGDLQSTYSGQPYLLTDSLGLGATVFSFDFAAPLDVSGASEIEGWVNSGANLLDRVTLGTGERVLRSVKSPGEYVSQTISGFTPGQRYQITAVVRGGGNAPVVAVAGIGQSAVSTTSDYTTVTFQFVASATAHTIQVVAAPGAGTDFNVDSIWGRLLVASSGREALPVVSWQTYPATDAAYTAARLIDIERGIIDPQHTEIGVTLPDFSIPPGYPIEVETNGP